MDRTEHTAEGPSGPDTTKAPDVGPFFHGTKADLRAGNVLTAGFTSNYRDGLTMNHIYFTAWPKGAGLAAEMARGPGRPRVYIVEPTGTFEDDPNVTDKKFPGNPTRSYRSRHPLKVVGEIETWEKFEDDFILTLRRKVEDGKGEIIN
jgi:rifampin ADP-ribosylating transferase